MAIVRQSMHAEHPASPARSQWLKRFVCRTGWGLLCLIHVAPTFSAMRDIIGQGVSATALLNSAYLWLALAFFALKFVDVRWLRWRLRKSNLMAFVVVCGLTHGDLSSDQAASALIAETPAALVASLCGEFIARSRRLLPKVLFQLSQLTADCPRFGPLAAYGTAIVAGASCCQRALDSNSTSRGPPFFS